MRLFIMFDLPMVTKKQVQNYNIFRRKILNLGFYMIQFSIYVRMCSNYDETLKYVEVIKNSLPPSGNVRCLQVTEKQYESMQLLVGEFSVQEKNTSIDLIIEL